MSRIAPSAIGLRHRLNKGPSIALDAWIRTFKDRVLMKKACLIAVVWSVCAGAPLLANAAGELRGELDIELTIGQGCEALGGSARDGNVFGTLNFGEHSSLNNTIDAESKAVSAGVIRLNCTRDVSYSIYLDNGRNAVSDTRHLLSDAGDGSSVAYHLYQDAARSTLWNPATPYGGVGSGQPVDVTVYGRIPPTATPAAGKYRDAVTVTVAW